MLSQVNKTNLKLYAHQKLYNNFCWTFLMPKENPCFGTIVNTFVYTWRSNIKVGFQSTFLNEQQTAENWLLVAFDYYISKTNSTAWCNSCDN